MKRILTSFCFLLFPQILFAGHVLDGVFPTILAPLDPPSGIDANGLKQQIEYVMKNGASGIVLLGSVGEGHYLSEENRGVMIQEADAILKGRGKLIVTVEGLSTQQAIAQAKAAERLGADFLSLQVPTFYSLNPQDVIEHIKQVVKSIDIPVLFYYYPDATRLCLSEDQLVEILLLKGVVGAKITSLDFAMVRRVVRRVREKKPEASIFTGTVFNLLWMLRQGGAGVIDPVSLFEPKVASELYRLYRQAEKSDMRDAQSLVRKAEDLQEYLLNYLPLFQEHWTDPNSLKFFFRTATGLGFGLEVGRVSHISRMKFLLHGRNIPMSDRVSSPLAQLSDEDIDIVERLEAYLKQDPLIQNGSLGFPVPGRLEAYGPQQHLRPTFLQALFRSVKRSRFSLL